MKIYFGKNTIYSKIPDPETSTNEIVIFGNGISGDIISGKSSSNINKSSGNIILSTGKTNSLIYGVSIFGAVTKYTFKTALIDFKENLNPLMFEIRHKSGGLKKRWYYDVDNLNCFSSIEFELNQYGSGAGTIQFANIDVPVLHDDIFLIYFDGEILYKAFFENDLIFSSDMKLKLSPFSKRLKEALFTKTYSTATDPLVVLGDVIEDTEDITGIIWNGNTIDIGDPIDVEAQDFLCKKAGSVIDDIVKTLQNRYWGVDNNNVFFIRQIETSKIKKYFYNSDEALYSSSEISQDYDSIERTEIVVTQNEAVIGTVGGTNPSYPKLDIAKSMRTIQGVEDANANLTTAEALSYYYEILKKELTASDTIEVKSFIYGKTKPKPMDYVLVETAWKDAFEELIDFDEAALTAATKIVYDEDSTKSAIQLSAATSIIDLSYEKRYFKSQKVSFYAKCLTDTEIQIAFLKDLSEINTATYNKLFLTGTNFWEYYDIVNTESLRYIVIKNASGIKFYDFKILCKKKYQGVGNISKIKFKINKSGINSDFSAGKITDYINDNLFTLQKKIEKLERS